MLAEQALAEVGDLAHLPEQLEPGSVAGELSYLRRPHELLERIEVVGPLDTLKGPVVRGPGQRVEQGLRAGEVELVISPDQAPHGREAVRLDGGDHVRAQLGQGAQGPEGAVIQVAPRAAGD